MLKHNFMLEMLCKGVLFLKLGNVKSWIPAVKKTVNPVSTLCMLGNFFKYLFLSNFSKNSLFPPIFFADIYNLNVKQFGSQMKPHILWGFIWTQIVCKGHQWSSKFTASGLRVNLSLLSVICKQLVSG